jgi:uncharacterized SAM-binding protein YcdF (DUF218 family)
MLALLAVTAPALSKMLLPALLLFLIILFFPLPLGQTRLWFRHSEQPRQALAAEAGTSAAEAVLFPVGSYQAAAAFAFFFSAWAAFFA